LWVVEAVEGSGLPGQFVRGKAVSGQQAVFARGSQLVQATAAEVSIGRTRQLRVVKEALHLRAEGAILGAAKKAAPPRLAAQGDFQRLPGLLISGLEGARELLAVVDETAGKEFHDGLATHADADSIAGSANELT